MPVFSTVNEKTENLYKNVKGILNNDSQSKPLRSPNVTKEAISCESADFKPAQYSTAINSLEVSLEGLNAKLYRSTATKAQITAARHAAVLTADLNAYRDMKPILSISNESGEVSMHDSPAVAYPSFGLEAFDPKENRNTQEMSVAYNFAAAQQSEFGEHNWPTITIAPNEFGVTIRSEMLYVMNNVKRNKDGSPDVFNRRSVIEAYVDHTILQKDNTRAVPVFRPESEQYFVDSAIIPPFYSKQTDNDKVLTSYLAVGKKFSLTAICQRDTFLTEGVMDQTDSIDPALKLSNLLIKFGNDVIDFKVLNLPTFNFLAAPQGNTRNHLLNAATTSLLISAKTLDAKGAALSTLGLVKTANKSVRVELVLNGAFNDETGLFNIMPGSISCYSVVNSNGQLEDMTAGDGKTIADIINAGEVIGFMQDSFYTNENRRLPVQLADTQYYHDVITVKGRAGIGFLSKANSNGTDADSDVAARIDGLLKLTRARLNNEAVTNLLAAWDELDAFTDVRDIYNTSPDVFGFGRRYIRPYSKLIPFDVSKMMDSLTSRDKADDLRAAFINRIRVDATEAWVKSNYQSAAEAINSGMAPLPTLVISTSPTIQQWLMLNGDLRIAVGMFDVRVVSNLDARMRDIMVMNFGVFDENRNVRPHPLNFGNLYWGPEAVLQANLNRTGSFRHETMVRPRYEFSVNCPVMVKYVVSGLEEAVSKNVFNTKSV